MAPLSWPIHRKENVWATKTNPGPHGLRVSIPLLVVVRDVFGYAETSKEAGMIIHQGKVIVDGKTRRDTRFPVGLMDVIEFKDTDMIYRVLPDHQRKYQFLPIGRDEAGFKLCRIVGKSTVKGGRLQINLHDGRNLFLNEAAGNYALNDVLKVNVLEQEILDHVSFRQGARIIVTGGRYQGRYGILIDLGSEAREKRTATIRTSDNEDIRTLAKYVFVVGNEIPLITVAGEL
jgi:small subunit ribosomal protein S4e